jgi:uncharacterized hydrophobic protein (TIGR00271 family)
MLYVRLVSPPELTERLTQTLAADSGVIDLVVLRGAARQPDGDAVQFNLQTHSANQILSQLRDLSLNARGPVTIDTIDAAIEGPERRTKLRGSWYGETAPAWEVVRARIRRDAAYAPSFFILLVIAGLIGAVGILINSQILIVAAMVVGPEYNAIISVAFGIERRDWHPVRGGLLALAVGFAAAIVMALIFAICIRLLGQVPAPFLAGLRPVADLINSPDLFSVVIAVLAGIVGVVSLTESKANAMIGVFISVTTIPAASAIGVSVAFGFWRDAEGSAVQLLLNVGLLIGVGALALGAQRRLWRGRAGPRSRS